MFNLDEVNKQLKLLKDSGKDILTIYGQFIF